MRRQSSTARRTATARKTIRWELLAERGAACEGCPLTPAGTTPARLWVDLHEVLTRGRGGDPTDKENILCLCRECHHFITVNPEWAEANGMMRNRSAEEHQRLFKPWQHTNSS